MGVAALLRLASLVGTVEGEGPTLTSGRESYDARSAASQEVRSTDSRVRRRREAYERSAASTCATCASVSANVPSVRTT